GSPRTHPLHMNEIDGPDWENQMLFRDYLRQHPEVAGEYGRLKTELAKRFPNDRDRYLYEKGPFIELVLDLARRERENNKQASRYANGST
ncbi:MAG: GrpB family protein, partial [Candidatus Promineifilaceae bacterium]